MNIPADHLELDQQQLNSEFSLPGTYLRLARRDEPRWTEDHPDILTQPTDGFAAWDRDVKWLPDDAPDRDYLDRIGRNRWPHAWNSVVELMLYRERQRYLVLSEQRMLGIGMEATAPAPDSGRERLYFFEFHEIHVCPLRFMRRRHYYMSQHGFYYRRSADPLRLQQFDLCSGGRWVLVKPFDPRQPRPIYGQREMGVERVANKYWYAEADGA